MTTAIIVPARVASQRLPAKLLRAVAGAPLVAHTARRLKSVAPPGVAVVFATDGDPRLAEIIRSEGCKVVETDPALPSGTDRLAAANREVGAVRILNVQADEPLVSSEQLKALLRLLEGGAAMATVARPFPDGPSFTEPNKVKVVCGLDGRALYFSRAPIPFARDVGGIFDSASLASRHCLWHQGLYAYTAETLDTFAKLPPSPLEQVERLEQLRALENGISIHVAIVNDAGIGVDTAEDLAALETLLTPQ
ncbi:MAG: 3-deoxy-manno-octulosonate cytidylyltransferase [Opitutales bacterium]